MLTLANMFADKVEDINYLETELNEKVRQESSVFEFLQAGTLDGIWYWDLENPDNEWISPKFWTVLGYDPSEKKHLASEWQDLIHPNDLKLAIKNFEKHCKDPAYPYDQVVRYKHKNGSTVWVRCRGIVIRDKSGKPVRMLGAHTDITQLKITEEKLKARTTELAEANKKLEITLEKIKSLHGLLPICSICKKIRDTDGNWDAIEQYVNKHSDTTFTHGYCPTCEDDIFKGMEKVHKDLL